MKKVVVLLLASVMLAGCAKQQYETRGAHCSAEDSPEAGIISISVPDGLSAPIMYADGGDRIYIADDYEVYLQTYPGGDTGETIRQCTGYDPAQLTVLETEKDGFKRYDCAWTSTGEGVQNVGRLLLLDDGHHHYVLSVIAPADCGEALNEAWKQLSDTFTVSTG